MFRRSFLRGRSADHMVLSGSSTSGPQTEPSRTDSRLTHLPGAPPGRTRRCYPCKLRAPAMVVRQIPTNGRGAALALPATLSAGAIAKVSVPPCRYRERKPWKGRDRSAWVCCTA
jgi:hypothetical protein